MLVLREFPQSYPLQKRKRSSKIGEVQSFSAEKEVQPLAMGKPKHCLLHGGLLTKGALNTKYYLKKKER